MMPKSLSMALPSLLKAGDALFGRVAAKLLPQPARRQLPDHFTSILIIRPGGIGDAALLAPLVAALQRQYEAVAIDVLAEKRNAGVFPLIPGLRSLYRYDNPAELLKVLRTEYDLVIDTEQWHRLSAVVARLSGTKFSIGFATNERSRLFTHTVPYSHGCYEARSFLNLLAPLGLQVEFNPEQPFLKVPGSAAVDFAGIDRPCIAIFPGASIRERLWGTEKFAHLARLFREAGFMPLVVGGNAEKRAGEAIAADGGVNFAGRTNLAGTAYIISRSRLLVSGDSGVLHIGVGLGIPTVSLFGPGIAAKWGPCGEKHLLIDKGMDCSPCTRFGYTPRCRRQARCLAEISVDEVHVAATALLNKFP